jgi:hypothetical protein
MNDQTWNSPGALAGATEAGIQSSADCNYNMPELQAIARRFSDALAQFEPDDRLTVLENAHEFLRAGMPIALFGSLMEEAAFWADRASRAERKAYGLACFNRYTPQEKAAFFAYVQQGMPHE